MTDSRNVSVSRGFAVILLVCYFAVGAVAVISTANTRQLQKQLRSVESELMQEQQHVFAHDPNADIALLRKLLGQKDAAYIELEDNYRKLQRESQAGQSSVADQSSVAPQSNNPDNPAATTRTSWLQRIRQEDPERYQQIQDARERRRQQVEEWYKDQFDRLDQRLQSAQTQEEGDLVNQIADALANVNELRQRWASIRELPEPERSTQVDQLRAETRQAQQTLRDLRARDRQIQLEQLAREIGYRTDSAAAGFVERVETIYRETQTNPFRGQFWGGQPPAP